MGERCNVMREMRIENERDGEIQIDGQIDGERDRERKRDKLCADVSDGDEEKYVARICLFVDNIYQK